MLKVLYHHAKFGGARISPATVTAKNVEFFVCLSVRHASVNTALSVRQVAQVVLREFYYLFPLKIVVHNFFSYNCYLVK